MKLNLEHRDGILFSDDEIPVAVTYDQEARFEFQLTPVRDYEGELEVYLSESKSMEHFLSTEGFGYELANKEENWSENNPIDVWYEIDSSFDNLDEVPLVEAEPLERELETLFGDYRSTSPTEAAEVLRDNYEFRRGEVFDRQEFVDKKVGQCDQFSELMSLINSNWIKHEGYSRQGDKNLPNCKLDFGNHAWVVDTQKEVVYDPTPLISHNKEKEWIERNTDVYFVRLPRVNVEVDGEEIPRRINKLGDEVEINYTVDLTSIEDF